MSPHAVTPPAEAPELDAAFLQKYLLTGNGFVPSEAPLACLPDPLYAPWERVIGNLSASLKAGTLRAQVDELPVLSTDNLRTEREWRRTYSIMGFLLHAYIWGGDRAAEVSSLPVYLPSLPSTLMKWPDFIPLDVHGHVWACWDEYTWTSWMHMSMHECTGTYMILQHHIWPHIYMHRHNTVPGYFLCLNHTKKKKKKETKKKAKENGEKEPR